MNNAIACASSAAILWFAGLVAMFAPAQTVQAQGWGVSQGEALAAPDIGGVRIRLQGWAMSGCGVRYHLLPRREPPNRLVIEISTSLVVGGPGCSFVPVTLGWMVPFAGLADGQYEVVVLSTNPPATVEMYRFAFGMPVAMGVPMAGRWTWMILIVGLLALAWRQRVRATAD